MTDVPVPPQRALVPKLGPSEAGAPTVIFEADPQALPLHIREQFCGSVENMAASEDEIAEVLVDENYSGRLRMVVLKFASGVKPHEALHLARKFKAWFFQNLADAGDRRQQAQMRRARRRARRAQERHARRHGRQELVFCVRRQMVPTH